MTQPFLYMRNRSSDPQVAVFKEINRQLIQVGEDFGVSDDNTYTRVRCSNRVIHWGNELLAVQNSGIWKFNAGLGINGQWEVFYNFASYNSGAESVHLMPFTPASIDGSGVLVTGYPSAGSNTNFRIVKIDRDLNVTEGPDRTIPRGDFVSDQMQFQNQIPYRNSIIWIEEGSAPRLTSYDLKTDFITPITLPDHSSTNGTSQGQMTVMREKPFVIGRGTVASVSRMKLWRVDGASAVNLGNVLKPEAGGLAQITRWDGGMALTSFKDKLYIFGHTSDPVSGGVQAFRLYEVELDDNDEILSSTDISHLLPAEITALTPSATSPFHKAFWRLDTVTNGPEDPILELELSPVLNVGGSPNAVRSLHTWNTAPTGSGWTFHGSAMGGQDFSYVDMTIGSSGPYIWPGSGVLNISIPNLSVNIDGLSIDAEFEVYGPAGTSGIVFEMYFDKDGELNTTKAQLNSTSVGSLVLAGTAVSGLAVGDVFSVNWAAVAQGIEAGDNPKIHGRVYIPTP